MKKLTLLPDEIEEASPLFTGLPGKIPKNEFKFFCQASANDKKFKKLTHKDKIRLF